MKPLFIILLLFFSSISFGQNFTRCEILHCFGDNKSNTQVLETKIYNSKGLVSYETSKHFKDSLPVKILDDSTFYFYEDTLLVYVISVNYNNDSTKIHHTYNKKRQRVKSEYYVLEWQPQKTAIREKIKCDDCKEAEANYMKDEIWKIKSITYYKYDNKGNKTQEIAPDIHWGSQKKSEWIYDNKNRIIKQKAYIIKKLSYDKKYSKDIYEYSDKGYKFTRTYYNIKANSKNKKANPQNSKEKQEGYSSRFTHTYRVNTSGQITEINVIDAKGKMVSRQEMEYNDFGLILKQTDFNKDNKPVETYRYKYN